jgi:NTE family protein
MKKNLSLRLVSVLILVSCFYLSACTALPPNQQAVATSAKPETTSPKSIPKPVIALALGGGGAKGFAHIGVIKALEAQGIVPDIVIGTSAGSVVGALYASGMTGFELQELAIPFSEGGITDIGLPDRGLLKGEALARFVNIAVRNQPIEKLPKKFGAVATKLATGEAVVFRTGDTGIATRASSSVPSIFRPVVISGSDYVDGGLVSPVPINLARQMGANFVIAVDISDLPINGKTSSTIDIFWQTQAIMTQAVINAEVANADVVIRPDTRNLTSVDFKNRNLAILEGEKAVARELTDLKLRLARFPDGSAQRKP